MVHTSTGSTVRGHPVVAEHKARRKIATPSHRPTRALKTSAIPSSWRATSLVDHRHHGVTRPPPPGCDALEGDLELLDLDVLNIGLNARLAGAMIDDSRRTCAIDSGSVRMPRRVGSDRPDTIEGARGDGRRHLGRPNTRTSGSLAGQRVPFEVGRQLVADAWQLVQQEVRRRRPAIGDVSSGNRASRRSKKSVVKQTTRSATAQAAR